MICRTLLAVIVWGVLLLPLAACAGTRTVTVTGWGAFDADGMDDARARALADALARAVQEAGRTAVAAETRVVNDWRVSSEVAAETYGLIRGYRIVDEGRDAARGYRVRLIAQVATGTVDAASGMRVLVFVREQYRGVYTPRQLLGSEVARRLRDKGFTVKAAEWGAPLVTLRQGDLKVSVEQVREVAQKHEVDWVLIVWAEARPGDTANPNLHFARALGRVLLYRGETGQMAGSRTVPEVTDGGSTPERAAEAALTALRGGLAQQAAVAVAAAGRR